MPKNHEEFYSPLSPEQLSTAQQAIERGHQTYLEGVNPPPIELSGQKKTPR